MWPNSNRTVKKLVQPGIAEVWMEGGVSVKTECDVKWLEPLTGSEKPAITRQLDTRSLHAGEKQAAISAAGGLLRFSPADGQLEHPELAAAGEMVNSEADTLKTALRAAYIWSQPQQKCFGTTGGAAEAVEQGNNRYSEDFRKLSQPI